MLIYGCRVNAFDEDTARQEVVRVLADKGLRPTVPPAPIPCRVQYGEGPLWECYCFVEAIA